MENADLDLAVLLGLELCVDLQFGPCSAHGADRRVRDDEKAEIGNPGLVAVFVRQQPEASGLDVEALGRFAFEHDLRHLRSVVVGAVFFDLGDGLLMFKNFFLKRKSHIEVDIFS